MRTPWLQRIVLAAALVAASRLCLGYEEKSLLTPDGTMHVVRAGKAVDLGLADATPSPESFVIEWSSRAQDGTVATALIPGTISYQEKRGLQLDFDEQTGKLLLLWIENVSAYSHVRVGVLQNGLWTNSPLMPLQGISRAYNPQMQVTHQTVTSLDDLDATVTATTSILSVVWWEEAQAVQARYAALFLDENGSDPGSLAVYNLPELAASTSAASYPDDVPSGAYLYPSLQTDGLSGSLVASFADLYDSKHKVVHIEFPRDRGKPSELGNLKWQRRHIPLSTVAVSGPVARMTPVLPHQTDPAGGVTTTIGAGYRPTLSWRDGAALKFTRLEGADWSTVRSIALDDTMGYEKALALVISMGLRN
ncbi:MAG: hypothetical protein ABI968_03595 [Acidobacteriota bacterium]